MEKPSFLDLLHQAQTLSFSSAAFFFGSLIALPLTVVSALLTTDTPPETSSTFIATTPFEVAMFLLTLILVFCFLFLGKSGLILSFHATLQKKPSSKKIFLRVLFSGFHKSLLLGGLIGGFFLVITSILLLPPLLSWAHTGEISSLLFSLSALTFLPIVLVGSIIQEFSFLYFLLSPLRMTSALNNSLRLFSYNQLLSLRFLLFTFSLSLLFTFSLNVVMLGIVALSQELGLISSSHLFFSLLAVMALGWFTAFKQALWMLFFRSIATPQEPETKEVVIEEVAGEISAL